MRSIDELLKLEKYDNLEHDEVILLINYYENLAYQKAYNEAVSAGIVADNYNNNLIMQSKIDESIELIKNCVLDFKGGADKKL